MEFKKIGIVHSCFKQKFGTPRQSQLAKSSFGTIEILKEFSHEDIVRGLNSFSHIWILFHFHKVKSWNPTVRPPRLGGNLKMGVFATRSPFRPNAIGMSILKIKEIRRTEGQIFIDVTGLDILDKTPVLDIKPYIPSIDSIEASSGWTDNEFSKIDDIKIPMELPAAEKEIIKEVIGLDPRPPHQKKIKKLFKVKIGEKDFHFKAQNNQAEIIQVIPSYQEPL